ncbi:MAG: hypothetical protein Q4F34_02515 [Prevotellaceae bacterium]|nr:hypothetical protein [Prevotellaceae bacterium]
MKRFYILLLTALCTLCASAETTTLTVRPRQVTVEKDTVFKKNFYIYPSSGKYRYYYANVSSSFYSESKMKEMLTTDGKYSQQSVAVGSASSLTISASKLTFPYTCYAFAAEDEDGNIVESTIQYFFYYYSRTAFAGMGVTKVENTDKATFNVTMNYGLAHYRHVLLADDGTLTDDAAIAAALKTKLNECATYSYTMSFVETFPSKVDSKYYVAYAGYTYNTTSKAFEMNEATFGYETYEFGHYEYESFEPFGASTGTWQMNSVFSAPAIFKNQQVQVGTFTTGGTNIKKIKIANFGAGTLTTKGVEFEMDWNTTTNKISFGKQETGKKNSNGYMIYIADNSFFSSGTNESVYNPVTGTFTITPVYFYKKDGASAYTSYSRQTEIFQMDMNVAISAVGWATACVPFKSKVATDNAVAYYVAAEGDKLVKTEAANIPAETGLLLKSNDGAAATVTFSASFEDADDVTGNMLKGTIAAEGEEFSGEGKYYILANDSQDGLGFYWQVADGVSANCAQYKAVLVVPTNAAKGYPFDFDEPTSINGITNAETKSALFNAQGIRVNNAYKGMIIVGGKKYLNK